jgi:hypothetical protein
MAERDAKADSSLMRGKGGCQSIPSYSRAFRAANGKLETRHAECYRMDFELCGLPSRVLLHPRREALNRPDTRLQQVGCRLPRDAMARPPRSWRACLLFLIKRSDFRVRRRGENPRDVKQGLGSTINWVQGGIQNSRVAAGSQDVNELLARRLMRYPAG